MSNFFYSHIEYVNKMPKWKQRWVNVQISGVIFKHSGHLGSDGGDGDGVELDPSHLPVVLVLKHLGHRHVGHVLEVVHGLDLDHGVVVVVLQVDEQLGGQPDPINRVVPHLLPLAGTQVHLFVCEKALVKKVLDELMLQVFPDEN